MVKPIFVNDNGLVKVFQLDFKVKNCVSFIRTIKERNLPETKLKEPWIIDEDVSESIDKIAISDAFSHKERLVFPAFWVKNGETGERHVCWTHDQIAGCWTFKMYGGDASSMKSTEEYIAELLAAQSSGE